MATTFEEIPSSQRIEPGSVNIAIGKLPQTAITDSPAVDHICDDFVNRFNDALRGKDIQSIANFFLAEVGYWRDQLALSWDFRTLKGTATISEFLAKEGVKLKSIAIDRSSTFRSPVFAPFFSISEVKGITSFITITTEVGIGRGMVRLAEEADTKSWKIFTLSTVLTDLDGHEELTGHRRPKGVEHGHHPKRENWHERRLAGLNFDSASPAVLIIGKS